MDEFEQFIAQPENANRLFELIDGEIIEKVPTEEHQIFASNLHLALGNFVRQRKLGRVLFEVRRRIPDDEHNARLPDVEFTSNERLKPVVRQGAVPQMPDLAVEIQSPNDTVLKLRAKALYYLENGSRMVWLVLRKRQIEVHTAEEVRVLGLDDTLDGGDVLPGFTLPVRDIYEE
jgi:Uma2 family endonuclease